MPPNLPHDFEPQEYLALHPDVKAAGMDPAKHYLKHGIREGRRYKRSGEAYDFDGLRSVHNHDFMRDQGFVRAYGRAVEAAGEDYHWHWRVHIGLWAAKVAAQQPGDFVECGVNRGALSSAIMTALDWNRQERTFYLLDTFSGLEPKHLSTEEIALGALQTNKAKLNSGFYVNDVESVRKNFSQWSNVELIVGSIPGTLGKVESHAVAFLHLDMNCTLPEVAALDFFWDRLTPGAVVLMDDYAYAGHHHQKQAIDTWAKALEVEIAALPTGQGLILKPNSSKVILHRAPNASPQPPATALATGPVDYCYVCGGNEFISVPVLWQELIEEWALNADEVAYINRQQGTSCKACRNNLRSIAIAKAILAKYDSRLTLQQFFRTAGSSLRVLSINTAGGLPPTLELLPGYRLVSYPEYDMRQLHTIESGYFDLVLHSDTLEHVPDPVRGLKECRRLLARNGSCIFTIPMIIGRSTAGREGKKPSYHGNPKTDSADWAVQTEYGADCWIHCVQAGFSSVTLHCLEHPSAYALECKA